MRYDRLVTESVNPRTRGLDQATSREIVALMNAEDRLVADAVAAAADAIAAVIDLVADRLGQGGRLIYVGAGTSGRIGALDAAECPPTFGAPPEQVQAILAGGSLAMASALEDVEDDPDAGAADIRDRQVDALDVVMGISASGTAAYVSGALAAAREVGAATVYFTCDPAVELPEWLDQEIRVVVGPEALGGSTRLKAGTATKMVLNMISTGAMVRLGKAYENLMVDVQPTNRKLHDRARRILVSITGCDEAEAERLLDLSGDLKVAIVMQAHNLDFVAATERLAAVGGRVRAALENRP